jgi:hypothetical protein
VPKKTPEDILNESYPDLEFIQKGRSDRKVNPAPQPGASIQDIRKKVLGVDAAARDAASHADGPPKSRAVSVRQVRSKAFPADPADDPGPQTKIYSDEEEIGTQG